MEIKIIKKQPDYNRSVLLVSDVTPAFVNAIRRTILESVPVMAIENVEFVNNTSVLYDEMLALRLGLIPLKTDLVGYTLPSECTCKGEGCAKCTLSFTLSAKGPCTVYASDLKSKDPAVVPVYPETPLVKLLKGQEIELNATACLGVGREHAKWVPAFVAYGYEPTVKVNNASPKFAEFKGRYPTQVFDGNKISDKKIVELGLVDACDGVCDDVVKVEYNDRRFIFTIETFGQLSSKDIIKYALETLKKQSEEFVKATEQ